jgi:hypothetical protein
MKKVLIISFSFFLIVLTSPLTVPEIMAENMATPLLLAQAKVATVPGFIEFVSLDSMLIKIDGVTYQLHEKVKVTSKGNTREVANIATGNFVIAAIKDNIVFAITLIPQNEGF